jgi:hypothetical protein
VFAESQPVLIKDSLPKLSAPVEHGIVDRLKGQGRVLAFSYAQDGKNTVFYSRKVGYFLQVLDFEPRVVDGKGRRRPPSEFKELRFAREDQARCALCLLNSNLFYWFVTVFSDCRHVNKREVDAFPIDLGAMTKSSTKRLVELAGDLMADLRRHSIERTMRFSHDTLTVQCIHAKMSKRIIDEIDTVLAKHYGFTDEELDFIINYDIKYRVGVEEDSDED